VNVPQPPQAFKRLVPATALSGFPGPPHLGGASRTGIAWLWARLRSRTRRQRVVRAAIRRAPLENAARLCRKALRLKNR
jgi:hypothetical protein